MVRRMLLAVIVATAFTCMARAEDPEWKLGVRVSTNRGNTSKIIEVIPNSPAEQIQLQAGDILISVNGEIASDPAETRRIVFASDKVEIVFRRGNDYLKATATFETVFETHLYQRTDGKGSASKVVATKKFKTSELKKIPTPRK